MHPLVRRLAIVSAGALIAGLAVTPAAAAPTGQRYVVVTERSGFRAQSLGGVADIASRYTPEVRQLTEEQAAATRDQSGVIAVVPETSATWVAPAPLYNSAIAASSVRSWGLDRIDQRYRPLDGSFSAGPYPGHGTTVVVIDSGVNANATEFGNRLLPGYDFVDKDEDASDCFGHGTHVAGTIASRDYGVARSANIVPLRVLDCKGGGSTVNMYLALHAVQQLIADKPDLVGHLLVNMSLGANVSEVGEDAAQQIDRAVADLVAAGVPVVVAAGNQASNVNTVTPARSDAPIVVGAVSRYDYRAWFSNYGPRVDILAPGEGITSIGRNGRAAADDGTSMAAPHVAGVLARNLERAGWSSANAVKWTLSDATRGLVHEAAGSTNRLLYLPTAPNRPSTTVSHDDARHSITITWKPPSAVTGFAVTGYVVERGGRSVRLPASARSYTWKSVTPGSKNVIKVRSVSAKANSLAVSHTVQMLPLPGSPRSVRATSGSTRDRSTSVSVSWQKPTSGKVTGYVIVARHTGNGSKVVRNVGAGTLKTSVSGLKKRARYQVTVQAKNAAGAGKSVKASSTPTAR